MTEIKQIPSEQSSGQNNNSSQKQVALQPAKEETSVWQKAKSICTTAALDTVNPLGSILRKTVSAQTRESLIDTYSDATSVIDEYGNEAYEFQPDDGFWARYAKGVGAGFLGVGKLFAKMGVGLGQLAASALPTKEYGYQTNIDTAKAVANGIKDGVVKTVAHPYDTHVAPLVDSVQKSCDPDENHMGELGEQITVAGLKIYGGVKSVEAVGNLATKAGVGHLAQKAGEVAKDTTHAVANSVPAPTMMGIVETATKEQVLVPMQGQGIVAEVLAEKAGQIATVTTQVFADTATATAQVAAGTVAIGTTEAATSATAPSENNPINGKKPTNQKSQSRQELTKDSPYNKEEMETSLQCIDKNIAKKIRETGDLFTPEEISKIEEYSKMYPDMSIDEIIKNRGNLTRLNGITHINEKEVCHELTDYVNKYDVFKHGDIKSAGTETLEIDKLIHSGSDVVPGQKLYRAVNDPGEIDRLLTLADKKAASPTSTVTFKPCKLTSTSKLQSVAYKYGMERKNVYMEIKVSPQCQSKGIDVNNFFRDHNLTRNRFDFQQEVLMASDSEFEIIGSRIEDGKIIFSATLK